MIFEKRRENDLDFVGFRLKKDSYWSETTTCLERVIYIPEVPISGFLW